MHLIITKCRRCGKPITTGTCSLYGNNELKARLGGICGNCITPDEKQELYESAGQSIIAKVVR